MTRLARLPLFACFALSAHALPSNRHFDLAGRLDSVKTLNASNAELFKADYGYNSLNQRTGVTREDGRVGTTEFGASVGSASVTQWSYWANSLNQYTSRTVPPYLSVTGEAALDANVAVQAKPAQRKGTAT